MKFQRSLGREVFEYDKDGITAKIIKHKLPFGKSYLYIPHGPEMDFNAMVGGFKNPVANFVRWLRELGRAEKSIFIKTEPLVDSVAQALVEQKFRKSKKEIQPSKTVVIDVDQDGNEMPAVSLSNLPAVSLSNLPAVSLSNLLGQMHHKTRYNIKVAEGHGITISESHDVDLFLKLLKKTTKRDKFSAHPDSYYRKLLGSPGLSMRLFLAHGGGKPFDKAQGRPFGKVQGRPFDVFDRLNVVSASNHKAQGKPIAGAIVLIHGDVGYYLHGASDYEYRSLMAPYALHWQIIKYLKENSLKHYDMWGIDASKWPGVTRFKLGWGGRTIEYSGSFDMQISKFWYLAYRLARKLF